MTAVAEEKEVYLDQFNRFEKQWAGHGDGRMEGLRQAAIARFQELGFPTNRNEDWKYTSVAALLKIPFELADQEQPGDKLRKLVGVGYGGPRLVFVNGHFAPELSELAALPNGVTVSSLGEALSWHPDQVRPKLAKLADYQSLSFTALNTAFLRDGAFVFVPPGRVLEQPIELVFVSVPAGKPTVSYPRTLIVAGRSSQATILERYLGPEEATYFTNAVTEIVAEDNAFLDHYKLQQEGARAFHIANTQVRQARSSNFTNHYVALGGALVRNEVRVRLDDEGCETTLNGLYLGAGSQHLDNFTVIDHAKPHCASHELYKGILADKARGVFNGKIFVRQDAQKTDAKQTNQALLLSDDATINTKPQLEIFADDVKCTHGATVGQLDADALFYLRARGIGLEEARRLLTFAFANDVLDRMKIEAVREQLERVLMSRRLTKDR
jgi:Fe-S cluster assembly protein SufD